MTKGRTYFKAALELICLALIFSFVLCIIPLSAEETDKAPEGNTVDVIKLVNNVERGTRIGKEDVELVQVKNVNIPSNAISDLEKVVYMYARTDLFAGEYVSVDQISESKVTKANSELLIKPISKSDENYVIVTDYVKPNTGDDLSVYIQQIIDNNPRKTIYFPDGVYTIANPIYTSGKGSASVCLQLADGAVIKAHQDWRGKSRGDGNDALIGLGGNDSTTNDIQGVGSYYCLMGGTLDGNSRANGVNIEGGRESLVRNVCIKNAKTGILIKDGVNNSSSDCDFEDITIIGNGLTTEIGIDIDACDNTFTNIRIYNVTTGIFCKRGGNLMKNVYVVNNADRLKTKATIGIIGNADNWISQCYVENCATAFSLRTKAIIADCTAVWTDGFCPTQTAFDVTAGTVPLSGCRADFNANGGSTFIYRKGSAVIECVIVDKSVNASGYEGVDVIPIA